ncbi:MAG: SusC/RagA family TonB-linked outer membrane protein [Saprospiraceae bacterium]|nr:SusC/RagA family TonB-linked outer membrane protein [Saprospiraceae bacterium]
MKKHFFNNPLALIVVMLLVSLTSMAQNKVNFSLKGKVSATEPIVGASVVIESTGLGSVSDVDGNYSIEGSITEGVHTVAVSFIGYSTTRTKVTIKAGSNVLDATLTEDVLNLGEVLVVGSSVLQERKQLGNAISTVRAEQLEKSGTSNAIQALQGKVAGAQISQNSGDPAGGISVRLRGPKSLAGSSEPLYVIDGVISNNNTVNITNANVDAGTTSSIGQNRLADLNPNDIESVNVLNGAAAAAIYGSRASNGVIIITTKKGKSGKPRISFSTSYSVNQLRKKSFISTYNKQFNPGDNTTTFDPKLQTLYPTAKGGNILNDSIAVWGSLVDVTRYDYQDNIFRDAGGTDNNLSVSGGSENTQYYASFGFMRNEGIIKNTDFQRITGRVRIDQKITNWLDASIGLAYTNGFSHEMPNGNVFFSPTNSINITNNIYDITQKDANGNYQAVERLSRLNPMSIIDGIKNTQRTNRVIADLRLTARPIEGMTLTYILGVDNTNQLGRNFSPIFPYQVNVAYFNKGYAANNTANTILYNNDINATYNFKKGILSSNTVAGFNYLFSREEIGLTQGRDLAPFIETVNGATVPLPSIFTDAPSSVAGGFIQETFGLNDRVFLTGAIRYDVSSRFPKETRGNYYPKVGLSYMVSDEPFWGGLKNVVSKARLRAAWGQTGNVTGFGVYDRFISFNSTSFNGLGAFNASSLLADPNVKVERNEELEVGGDFSFAQDFVTLGVNVYKQTAKDLLLGIAVGPSTGYSTTKTNVGTLENKGFELTLNINPIKTQKLNWSIYGTLSHNDNKITSLPGGLTQLASPTGAPIFLVQGAAVGVFYGNFYARDDAGNILLRPIKVSILKDGKVTEVQVNKLPQVERGAAQGTNFLNPTGARGADGQPSITGANSTVLRKVIGNPNPRNIWSLGTNLTYGKLTFTALLDAVEGMEIWNADKRTRNNVGIGQIAEQELKGEVPRGSVAAYAGIDEFRVDDGSFIKLREMSLSYDLGNIVKGVNNLQLVLTGRNLYSWDNYFGYDPETSSTGQSSVARGVDFGNSPIPRSYQFMIRANF